jgi:hypothetical protein
MRNDKLGVSVPKMGLFLNCARFRAVANVLGKSVSGTLTC